MTLTAFSTAVITATGITWPGNSYIELRPTGEAGCPIEVVFQNEAVHPDQAVSYELTLDGITLTVSLVLGRGNTPDDITVTADGMVAIPETLSVDEHAQGSITVCHAMF